MYGQLGGNTNKCNKVVRTHIHTHSVGIAIHPLYVNFLKCKLMYANEQVWLGVCLVIFAPATCNGQLAITL